MCRPPAIRALRRTAQGQLLRTAFGKCLLLFDTESTRRGSENLDSERCIFG